MGKGRVVKEEQARRTKLLLLFIFTFRYATGSQLGMFIRQIINMSYTRRLIAYSLKKGYIKDCYEFLSKSRIYYLTKKGRDFIHEEECFVKSYRFEKSLLGINTFRQHNMVVEVYFQLKKRLIINGWDCAWVLRMGTHRRNLVPDSFIALKLGINIVLEAEIHPKNFSALKRMIDVYRYEIDKNSKYNGVLMVIEYKFNYESIKKSLFRLAPEFCSRAFVLADLNMFNQGQCFYQNEVRNIEEAFNLLVERRNTLNKH